MRKHFHKAGVGLLAMGILLSTGCVSSAYRQPVAAVPSAFIPYEGQGTTSSLDRWWLLFGDVQLTALIDEALAHAPDARTALAVLEEARATRSQALTSFDPQGNPSASAARQRTSTTGVPTVWQGVYSGAFSPTWEVDLFGRKAATRRAADADLDEARFAYEGSRQSLASNVAGDLFEARGDAVRLDQARSTLRIASDLARLGERRIATGIGAPADAASLQADEATAQANVRALEAQLDTAKRSLLVLLGRGTQSVDTLVIESYLAAPPAIPAATPATLLLRRPDVRQAEAHLRSAAGNLQLDSRALLPKINLLPSVTYAPETGPLALSTTLLSAGAGLTMPLFDRKRLLAQVRGQRARTEQAVIAYENAVQAGFGEAQSNLVIYAADRAQLDALARAEERARAAFLAQRAGYQAGVVDLTTLLQAERTWRSNLLALSNLRITALIDTVNVFRALGGGWPAGPDMALADAPLNRKDVQ